MNTTGGKRLFLVATLGTAAVAGGFAWRLHHGSPRASPDAVSAPTTPRTVPIETQSPAAGPVPAETSSLADALNSPAHDVRADLHILTACLANFRSNFPRAGDPVGTNAEITAALTGKNPLRYAVIPPNHPAINRAGELCDRWGTPFFFHAESGTRMTVRSAGPDRKMWTEDDIESGR
jgi:hypothetical protein